MSALIGLSIEFRPLVIGVAPDEFRMNCSFCNNVSSEDVLIEGELCFFMDTGDPVHKNRRLTGADRESIADR